MHHQMLLVVYNWHLGYGRLMPQRKIQQTVKMMSALMINANLIACALMKA